VRGRAGGRTPVGAGRRPGLVARHPAHAPLRIEQPGEGNPPDGFRPGRAPRRPAAPDRSAPMKPLADVTLIAAEEPVVLAFPRERLGSLPSPPTAAVDWQLVVALRRKASDLITRRLTEATQDGAPPLSAVDRRLLGRAVVRSV